MTKARMLVTAGLIHLTVAALFAMSLLCSQPSSATGSELIVTDTHTPAPSSTPTTTTPTKDGNHQSRCNLTITKSASPTEVLPGDLVTIVIRVCNEGDEVCKDVIVSDALPSELEVVSASASQGRAVIVGNGVRAEFGDLLPDVCAELTIGAQVRNDVDLCTHFVNVATIGDLVSNMVTFTVPCLLPPSGELDPRRGARAAQAVEVGLLVVGIGLVITGVSLRTRSKQTYSTQAKS